MAESNAIAQYLTDHYDQARSLAMDTEPEKYLINQWLMFQAASQGAIYAQVPSDHFICFLGCQADSVFQTLQAARKGNSAAVKHLQEIVKRTLGTVNDALKGKEYLVGNTV